MRESIFRSSVRSFCIALFSLLGVSAGVIGFILLVSLVGEHKEEIERNYTPKVLPNADGVRKGVSKEAPVVLQLNIAGTVGLNQLTEESIREQLVESREGELKDGRVKALLLNINSPGGGVVDSEGIYHAIKAYKEKYKVPVYAYVDGLAASGAFLAAIAADKIYASDSSLIGSVGVIVLPFFNVSKLLEKIGIESLTLFEGKGKDALDPFRPWRPGEQNNLEVITKYYYDQFVQFVTTNRPRVDANKLVDVYGAQVFPAPSAEEIGFIDGSGYSYKDVLKLLLKEINIQDDYYQVVQLEKGWFAKLFSQENMLFRGEIRHTFGGCFGMEMDLIEKFSGRCLYLYRFAEGV